MSARCTKNAPLIAAPWPWTIAAAAPWQIVWRASTTRRVTNLEDSRRATDHDKRQGDTHRQLYPDHRDRIGIHNRLVRVVLGTGFDPADFLAYAGGALAVIVVEAAYRGRNRHA